MEKTKKALRIIGILGIVVGILGYVGLATGGPLGDFMRGALPGILIGLTALVCVVA